MIHVKLAKKENSTGSDDDTKNISYFARKVLKWNAAMFHLELDPLDDVAILRYEIFKETQVKQERQKILNLKAKGGNTTSLAASPNISNLIVRFLIVGKKVDDTTKISELDIKPGKPLMMVGSLEADIASVNEKPDGIEVINDFEDEQNDNEPFETKEVYLSKIRRRIKEYKFEILNPPREGKKLLVRTREKAIWSGT